MNNKKFNKTEIWSNRIVKDVVDGTVYGEWYASGLSLDSRNIKKGDIFVAFVGEKVDGHDYVIDAFSRGASAAIVEKIPVNCDIKKHNLILVKDSFKAMEDLAIFHRKRCNAKIIAVTGSSGKTTTKEQLFLAFSRFGKTYASIGNFNGRLGLPISIASMPIDTEYGIFELGMSYAGEMTERAKVIAPDIAIITNIFPCHIENFNSLKEIALAKSEIFSGMSQSGKAIINAETSYSDVLLSEAKRSDLSGIFTFGESHTNDSYLSSYFVSGRSAEVVANIFGKDLHFALSVLGKHHAMNAVAVLSAVETVGLDSAIACLELQKFCNIKGRGEIEEVITKRCKKITLIDDSYNANPGSVRASLASLDEIHGEKRTVVVLSDMRELGEHSVKEHKSLIDPINRHNVDKVITVGNAMKNLYDEMEESKRYGHFVSYKEAIENIDDLLEDGDCVLVKGSNGTKIYELVNYLKDKK